MIFIMLGAPASGKGSVAELLSKHYDIPAISSGDIFRKNISEQTELGLKAKEYMDKGLLVPDDVTINMIKDRLKEPDTVNGMILDGFPRTVAQAKALDEMLEKDGKQIDCVVNLESKEDEILARVVNRRVCSKCKAIFNTVLHPSKVEGVCDNCGGKLVQRDDDTLEKAKNRLVVYYKETAPVAKYYERTGKLFNTLLSESANRMKHEVSHDIYKHMDEKA